MNTTELKMVEKYHKLVAEYSYTGSLQFYEQYLHYHAKLHPNYSTYLNVRLAEIEAQMNLIKEILPFSFPTIWELKDMGCSVY